MAHMNSAASALGTWSKVGGPYVEASSRTRALTRASASSVKAVPLGAAAVPSAGHDLYLPPLGRDVSGDVGRLHHHSRRRTVEPMLERLFNPFRQRELQLRLRTSL